MASRHKDKTADLPPKGPRNPDPITDEPGSHPIETGVGAALGGAAAGLGAGLVGGPVGAAVGAVAGGIVGGLAGKGIGEWIDPTQEEQWVKEYYDSRPDPERANHRDVADYRGPYHYGLTAQREYSGRRFEEVEPNLRSGWDRQEAASQMPWEEARPAVRHAYCCKIDVKGLARLEMDCCSIRSGAPPFPPPYTGGSEGG
jgi:hypothetical protein